MIDKISCLLSQLLADYISVPAQWDMPITGLALDSRAIMPGYLFFAVPGQQVDGRQYIADAIARGAVAVIGEADVINQPFVVQEYNGRQIPIFSIPCLAELIGPIAARFYQHPSEKLLVIGITGTSGKTSISQFIAKSLSLSGKSCGVIGTLGHGLVGQLQEGTHTTPDAITVQRILAELLQQGAQAVAMEVSSHALDQGRVNGVQFDIAVYSNLSHEHLDYHGDMAQYAAAKRRLFDVPTLQYAILNADDDYGRRWLTELQGKLAMYGYTMVGNCPTAHGTAMISAEQVRQEHASTSAYVHTPWGNGQLTTSLLGHFNVSNCLVVLTILSIVGVPLAQAVQHIAQLTPVAGRMEAFGGGDVPLVIVDYAHKPEPLRLALQTLRLHCVGQLWCVFGCGGNRDRGKRPVMGQIAAELADQVVVTSDNPRHEDPLAIIEEITQGISTPKLHVEPDRLRAIQYALTHAQQGDVVLIAGKGHEDYQILGDTKITFSDVEEVQKILQQLENSKE